MKGVVPGDFIISPFAFSNGTCENCKVGFQTACIHGGFLGQVVTDDGGQAQYVRVSQADGTLVARSSFPVSSRRRCQPG